MQTVMKIIEYFIICFMGHILQETMTPCVLQDRIPMPCIV